MIGTIVVLAILICVVALIVWSILRDKGKAKKKGASGCSGGCSGCSGCCH